MGQTSCKPCSCKFREPEVIIRESEVFASQADYRNYIATYVDSEIESSNLSSVVKIQSFVRKLLSQVRLKNFLRVSKPKFPYFSLEEVKETLSTTSRGQLNLERKPPYKYKSGGVYKGEWKGGFREGYGVMQYQDGARYEGSWEWGRPYGMGRFITSDGEQFTGIWQHYFGAGVEDGYSNGYLEWLVNKYAHKSAPSSELQRILGRFESIKHELRKNIPNIKVNERTETRYSDGSLFIGEIVEGLREGMGKLVWPDGELYEGNWKQDQQEGWGTAKFTDGGTYSGQFKNDQKQGVGMYEWEEGTQYIGEWANNAMQGVGKYKWLDGKEYLGDWHQGTMQGYGVLTWKDGRKFEGTWLKGKKHGEGISYLPNGEASKDVWKHGKIIKPDLANR